MSRFYKSQFFQNFSYLAVANIVSQLLAVVTILKISTLFSVGLYGLYSLIFTQAQLVTMVADLGLKYIVIRKVSRDTCSIRDVIVNGLKLRLLALLALYFLYQLYNIAFGELDQAHLSIIFIFSILSCYSGLLENVFLGRQEMGVPAVLNLAFNLVWTIFVFALPEAYFTLDNLLLVQIAIGFFKILFFSVILDRRGGLQGATSSFIVSARSLVRESWPYFAQMLLILPVTYLSYNFLDYNSTHEEIAFFSIAQKITNPATLIFSMAFITIYPRLSQIWPINHVRFSELANQGASLFLLPAALACFLFTIFIPDLFLILFDKKYLPAVEVSQLQIWYVFFMGVNTFIGTVWGASNKEKLIFNSSVVNAVISTPMLFLGSYAGAHGIAIGYLLSFIIFEVYLWRKFSQSLTGGQTKCLNPGQWLIVAIFMASSFVLAEISTLSLKIAISVVLVLCLAFRLGILNNGFKIKSR